jgi:hypothetical protein
VIFVTLITTGPPVVGEAVEDEKSLVADSKVEIAAVAKELASVDMTDASDVVTATVVPVVVNAALVADVASLLDRDEAPFVSVVTAADMDAAVDDASDVDARDVEASEIVRVFETQLSGPVPGYEESLNPGRHEHSNDPIVSVHVALIEHGNDRHNSQASLKNKKREME